MFLDERIFKTPVFFLIVCAEAYNPDEEEDDAESRVCNLLNKLILSYTLVLNKENYNRKDVNRRCSRTVLTVFLPSLIS